MSRGARSRPAPSTLAAAAALVIPALLAAGCRRPADPQPLDLLARVHAGAFSPARPTSELRFSARPEVAEVTCDLVRRTAVVAPLAGWEWRGRLPEAPRLEVGVQLLPESWERWRNARVRVTVACCGGDEEVVKTVRLHGGAERRWVDFDVDLTRWAGEEVTVAAAVGLGEGRRRRAVNATAAGSAPSAPSDAADSARLIAATAADRVAWAPVVLAGGGEGRSPAARPNIVFVLIDTLRFDRLSANGYERDTTPEIDQLLAERGTSLDEAYAQAPWTLPSAVSFLTGRHPGELLHGDVASFGIPAGVSSLAERLAALGYRTAGFVGNPTLHAGNGFARGFDLFFSPSTSWDALFLHADEITNRAVPWLAAHQHGPFFLYLHYIDPHDPYESPELVRGRSPFYPDYAGTIGGRHVHGVYTGRYQVTAEDVEQLRALYDSEVRYVDRHVGQLLRALRPETLRDTLVVLTSDHGEELADHGGWKHGQTLYEEQIHVPLLWRWDGRIAAGERRRGTVRLLDLMPTLIAAAGGEADPAWDGVDLLPALTGGGPLPVRHAFGEHLTSGPLRAMAVEDRRKLVLFNRAAPLAPTDDLQGHLWRQDLARLERLEIYDLERDPGERNRLAPEPRDARAVAVIADQLDRELGGLRLVMSGVPAGRRLLGKIVLDRSPASWQPYFLAEEDRVAWQGGELRFDWTGDWLEKGVIIEGDFTRVEAVELRLDPPADRPPGWVVPGARAAIGPAGAIAGWPIAALRAAARPAAPPGPPAPLVRLWLATRAAAAAPVSEETLRQLQALGYVE